MLTTLNGLGGSCEFRILDILPAGLVATSPLVGFPSTKIHGGNTVVSPPTSSPTGFNVTEQNCLEFHDVGTVTVDALWFNGHSSAAENSGIFATGNSTILVTGFCNFGPLNSHHINALQSATIRVLGPHKWSGGTVDTGEGYTCESTWCAETGGQIFVGTDGTNAATWTHENDNPNFVLFDTASAFCPSNGTITFDATFNWSAGTSGPVQGPRFLIQAGGVINTGGAGITALPGDTAGQNNGGTYL